MSWKVWVEQDNPKEFSAEQLLQDQLCSIDGFPFLTLLTSRQIYKTFIKNLQTFIKTLSG